MNQSNREAAYFRHTLPNGRRVSSKDERILDICSGQKVIHVGCVDWPLTRERIRQGQLLHSRILEVSPRCIGIDVDYEGIVELESELGGDYLAFDIAHLSDLHAAFPPELKQEQFDLIIVGDVIEHVPDAQSFLTGLRRLCAETGAQAIVTTPNALAVRSSINTLAGLEMMHPDHTAIHSPRTLQTLLERAELRVIGWEYYRIKTGSRVSRRLYDSAVRICSWVRPQFSDGIMVRVVA